MLSQLRPAFVLFLLLTFVTGIAYPLSVTGLAQVLFPHAANGSILVHNDQRIGCELIGQAFTSQKYFWGRPSATSPTPYNSAASAGSNLGPTNPQFLSNLQARVEAIKAAHPDQRVPVPGDLVTASGSGLDPHISPAAAEYQIHRVAIARNLPTEVVRKLVQENSEHRDLAVLGEPRVNVLKLNLALDTWESP